MLNPVEHVTYYINHRNQREAQIMAVLTEHSTKSFTPMELVKIIYVVCILCIHFCVCSYYEHPFKNKCKHPVLI